MKISKSCYFTDTDDGKLFKEREKEIVSERLRKLQAIEESARTYVSTTTPIKSPRPATTKRPTMKVTSRDDGSSMASSTMKSPTAANIQEEEVAEFGGTLSSTMASNVDYNLASLQGSISLPALAIDDSIFGEATALFPPPSAPEAATSLKGSSSYSYSMLGRDGKEYRRPSTFDVYGNLRLEAIKSKFTKNVTSLPALNSRVRGMRNDEGRTQTIEKDKKRHGVLATDFKIFPTVLNYGKVIDGRRYSMKLTAQNMHTKFIRFNVSVCLSSEPLWKHGLKYEKQRVTVTPVFQTGPIPGGLTRSIEFILEAIEPGPIEDIDIEIETPHCIYRIPISGEVLKRIDHHLEDVGNMVTSL